MQVGYNRDVPDTSNVYADLQMTWNNPEKDESGKYA